MTGSGEVNLIKAVLLFSDGQEDTSPLVFFDVGANVGDWTDAVLGRATSHCFEIGSASVVALHERFAGKENVTINDFGLSNTDGIITYKNYGDHCAVNTTILLASLNDEKMPWTLQECKVVQGDKYVAQLGIERIALLKIDTEGSELSILNGFKNMITRHKIDVIQFEYGYNNGDARALLRDFYELLEPSGYRIGRLTNSGVAFRNFDILMNNFESGPNYVAALPHYAQILTPFRDK